LLPVRAAGGARRLVAGLVDLSILLVTAGLLNWGLLALVGVPPLIAEPRGFALLLGLLELDAWALLLRSMPFLGMSALYFALFWSATGKTPGARWLRFRVIDERGSPPHPARAAVRVVGLFLGGLLGALGWWWTVLDIEKRGWHDHLARTYVVKDA